MLGGSDNVCGMTTLANSKFALLAGAQFLLYAAEKAVQDYFVGSLRINHVGAACYFGYHPHMEYLQLFPVLRSFLEVLHGSGSCCLIVLSCERD